MSSMFLLVYKKQLYIYWIKKGISDSLLASEALYRQPIDLIPLKVKIHFSTNKQVLDTNFKDWICSTLQKFVSKKSRRMLLKNQELQQILDLWIIKVNTFDIKISNNCICRWNGIKSREWHFQLFYIPISIYNANHWLKNYLFVNIHGWNNICFKSTYRQKIYV